MYKVTIIDKSENGYEDILIRDKESLDALMDFVWQPVEVAGVSVCRDYPDGFVVIVATYGEPIRIKTCDAYSAGALTAYFMSDKHFKSGDEICAKRGEGDE